MSEEPGRSWGGGLVGRILVEAPSSFIAGHPKAALLFWFFGNFRCGVPLFVVVPVVYAFIKIGKSRCKMLD